jgi:hypothetical protein
MIDLLLAEVLVGLDLAGRELGGAQLRCGAGRGDLDTRPVQVIAVGDFPVEAHAVTAVGGGVEAKRLVRRQEVITV